MSYREGGYPGRGIELVPTFGARVHRQKDGGARRFETAKPAIPHGEGHGTGNGLDAEDTLPVPRCAECKDRIFYEWGFWYHAELVLDKDHDAQPEICHLTGRRDHERIES